MVVLVWRAVSCRTTVTSHATTTLTLHHVPAICARRPAPTRNMVNFLHAQQAEVVCADITHDTVGVGAAMAWSLDCVGIVIIFPNVLAQVLHG